MYTPAFIVRRRLENKFGVKFSVQTTLNGGLKIKWLGKVDVFTVSIAIRDFPCDKHYSVWSALDQKWKPYQELRKTYTQLRK